MRSYKFAITVLFTLVLASGFVFAESGSSVKTFNVSGKAEYLKKNTTDWAALSTGMLLYSGDSIKTHEKSGVEIAFDKRKKNVVQISADSHVVLKLTKEEKIELVDGEIFALIKSIPRGSKFEVRTPAAVCGARGTGFGAKTGKNKTVVSSYEHDSYAKGIGKDGKIMEDNLTVKQGFKTIVKKFQKPSKPSKIGSWNYGKWHSWKDNLDDRIKGRKKKTDLGKNLEKILGQKSKIFEKGDKDRIKDKLSQKQEQKTEPERVVENRYED